MYKVTHFTANCDPPTEMIDGVHYRVEPSTGELIPQVEIKVDIGSMIIPPDEVRKKEEAHNRQMDGLGKKNSQDIKVARSDANYFFVDCLSGFHSMDCWSLARLFFLCTYMAGGSKMGDETLYRTERSVMNVADLPDLMGVSRQTCARFLKEAHEYITVHKSGVLTVNTEVFKRGKLPHVYMELQRIFTKEYRELFRSLPKNLHRLLGVVLKLIPYISREYNIVCENPCEKGIELVRPLPFKQICELVGIDPNESSRVKKRLEGITLPPGIRGQGEPFITLLPYGDVISIPALFVNPSIMYCGTDESIVKAMGGFTHGKA